MNKEVMFCYYHMLLSSGVSDFRRPMHRLWCQHNPSLADVSEQRLADQKRFLLTSAWETDRVRVGGDQTRGRTGWITRIRFVICYDR